VAGHAGFAAGLISAVEKVSGRTGVFRGLSNDGCDAAALEAALRAALADHGARVVFTDLPAGSCTVAARRIAHAEPDLAVVTGATLPMLLDFALGADGSLDVVSAIERAVTKGRDGITVTLPPGAERGD
jgi:PTS system N-acetylgalactosamine-specific IIA component